MIISFRADIINEEVSIKLDEFLENSLPDLERCFYVKEYGSKTGKYHIQGVAFIKSIVALQDKHMKSYRLRYKEMLGLKQGQFTFTECMDEWKYIKYLLKDVKTLDDLFFLREYSIDELQSLIGTWVSPSTTQTVGQVPIGKKLIMKLETQKHLFIENSILDQQKLFVLVTRFFGEETKKFRVFLLEEYFNTAYYHFCPVGCATDMLREITDRKPLYKVSLEDGRIHSHRDGHLGYVSVLELLSKH